MRSKRITRESRRREDEDEEDDEEQQQGEQEEEEEEEEVEVEEEEAEEEEEEEEFLIFVPTPSCNAALQYEMGIVFGQNNNERHKHVKCLYCHPDKNHKNKIM